MVFRNLAEIARMTPPSFHETFKFVTVTQLMTNMIARVWLELGKSV